MTNLPAPLLAMSVLRSSAGAISWVSPKNSWRVFGLGPMSEPGSAGGVTRLFGVRDLALGVALQHRNPDVRRASIQAGMVIDVADVAASLLAYRAGAPGRSLLGVAAGASLFVGLGAWGLREL
ncbi:hypothetical protein ACNHUS_23075 [Actinomycetes bacterium M1A6_2h]